MLCCEAELCVDFILDGVDIQYKQGYFCVDMPCEELLQKNILHVGRE